MKDQLRSISSIFISSLYNDKKRYITQPFPFPSHSYSKLKKHQHSLQSSEVRIDIFSETDCGTTFIKRPLVSMKVHSTHLSWNPFVFAENVISLQYSLDMTGPERPDASLRGLNEIIIPIYHLCPLLDKFPNF